MSSPSTSIFENSNGIVLRDKAPTACAMLDDVLESLAENPKRFPSQYLYDERGADLFEQICETPEYYITRTEVSMMLDYMPEIAQVIGPNPAVVEPGSGSGIKTRILLEKLQAPQGYVPIDVAKDQLRAVAGELNQEFPELEVVPVCADFTSYYELPEVVDSGERTIVYCPGSTIGNFVPDQAVDLLRRMSQICGTDGLIFLGVDLKKDASIIEAAYDDQAGVSRTFALNILSRLNRELGADFDEDQFDYEAPYNEERGRVEMALVSKMSQSVMLDGSEVDLASQERIYTEYSYKYSLDEFESLADRASLNVGQVWTDDDQHFSLHLLKPRASKTATK